MSTWFCFTLLFPIKLVNFIIYSTYYFSFSRVDISNDFTDDKLSYLFLLSGCLIIMSSIVLFYFHKVTLPDWSIFKLKYLNLILQLQIFKRLKKSTAPLTDWKDFPERFWESSSIAR